MLAGSPHPSRLRRATFPQGKAKGKKHLLTGMQKEKGFPWGKLSSEARLMRGAFGHG